MSPWSRSLPFVLSLLAFVLSPHARTAAPPRARAGLGLLHAESCRCPLREPIRPSTRPVVNLVFPGTGADSAGLKIGDVLMRVAGRDVPTEMALTRALAGRRPGDRVEVVVRR